MKKILFALAKSEVGSKIVGLTFEKFSKLLPVNTVYEDDKVIAFKHPKPNYKKHILIVPKKAIKSLLEINDNLEYIAAIMNAVEVVANKEKMQSGYWLVCNGGKFQEVKQLHFHLYTN